MSGAYSCALGGAAGRPSAAAPGDVVFVAALAAIELLARVNRQVPIRAVAGPASVALTAWPDEIRSCAGEQARRSLAPLVADLPAGPHLALTLELGPEDGPPDAADDAALHIVCRIGPDRLQAELRCAESDPWFRMRAAVAEIFAEVLRELLLEPARRALDAQGIGAASRALVLGPLSGPAHDYGPFRAIPHLIEQCVDRDPDRPAVTFGGQTLSYRRFDRLANGVAAGLAARGIAKGDAVPVLLVNGLEMPIAYHALMKLGAAFVPLDPAWPADRISATLEVLAPKLVVCTDEAVIPPPYRDRALRLAVAELVERAQRPQVELLPDDAIYGLFTSGTTGKPKCALNTHAGLANRFLFKTRYFGVSGDEILLQNSRHTFDSSVWQMFWPLTFGARTVIPAQGAFLDVEHMIDNIAAHDVTFTDFVPSIFNMMVSIVERDPAALRKITGLRQLIIGGEEINPQMVFRLQALLPHVSVTNGYGPTETAIGMVFHTLSAADGETNPLGRPIDNCHVVIVDDEQRLLPPGAVGEMLLGGVCVGSGYFRDPQRTAEAFLPNPFPSIPGARLYRSGDLGYFGPDGLVYFLGRKDFQVKIGGVRIELGELEVIAESCPHVRTAKVLLAQRGAEKSLAVFAAGDEDLTERALRDHMRGALPRHSVPRHYFRLDQMPLTDNGKVDRKALQALLDEKLAGDAAALESADVPTLALDRVLHVFRAVLQAPRLAADDDFLDAGGDSIQALAAVQKLATAFELSLGAQDLFDNPTALALCRLIERKQSGAGAELEDEAVLMARDALLPADVAIGPLPASAPLRTVLLTGATGFVGSRLLHELLSRTDLQVVCIVRAGDDAQAAHRTIAALADKGLWDARFAPRLEARAGDLAQARLGLAPALWDDLARRCDLILHNGALVNFLFDYRAHRAPNVLGTHELLRLATAARPKPLHYVSTLGVLDGEAARRPEPLGENFDPADALLPVSGYSRSKWVAERCLLEARRQGAVITILRLGEVMPSADNGAPNQQALTHFLLSAFHQLGISPAAALCSDYTPVDHVAARVVASLTDRASWGRTLHVFHPERVDFGQVLARAGAPTAPVSCGDFLARLERAVATTQERDLVTLHALLRVLLPPPSQADEAALRRAFSGLLVDNPRLFRNDVCRAADRRWGLADQPLDAAIQAYRDALARPLERSAAAGGVRSG